jgi:ATP-dependent protease ClpP protease subunit
MSRLELRGVIVPSEYDSEWAQKYIDKGIIIPESRFRANLNGVPKGEPLTIYVNSPGGSVFAAGEMINAVREWKAETKQPVTVILGALTASAASAFTIMAADTIKAHANAKMMFHGAWTMSIGGKELHQDTAELLGKINADIKARLVGKYGMSPEVVSEWFAEGREGWLTASELVEAKLASEIIQDPSDVIEYDKESMSEIEGNGLGIAALLQTNVESNHDDGTTNDKPAAGGGDSDGDPGASDGAVNDGEPDQGGRYQAGVVAGRAEQVAIDAERIEQLEEQSRKLQSDRDKARAEAEKLACQIASLTASNAAQLAQAAERHASELADMTFQLATMQAKCERLVNGGMAFSPDSADKAGRTAGDVDPRNRLHPALR